MCQQSPTCGTPATGATSQHHFVTPTSRRRAPIAHKMEVALGASETIRTSGFFWAGIRSGGIAAGWRLLAHGIGREYCGAAADSGDWVSSLQTGNRREIAGAAVQFPGDESAND